MQTFIVRRVIRSVPVLFVVSLLVFGALHILPGDPFLASQGTQVTLTAEDPKTHSIITLPPSK